MEENRYDYFQGDSEGRPPQTSHLKYHFRLRNLTSSGVTTTELEDRILRELSTKFMTDFHCDSFKVQDLGRGKSEILLGFRFDRQAEKLKGAEITVRSLGTTRFEPTEAFQALMDFRSRKKQQRPRSRSPRNSAPMVLVVCPPKKVEDKDVLSELERLRIEETPIIEHVFTNLNEFGGGHIIKLSFQHVRTIEELTNSEFSLKGKPVLLLQPSLKHDIEKSVNHAIVHHQVLVDADEFTAEEISNEMDQFGRVCQIDKKKNKFLVTFTQFRSAKEAIGSKFISIRDRKLDITKNSI
jgi:hypothetical protein